MDSDQKDPCYYTAFMHLAIDVRAACHPQYTGKGRWTYACVQALLRREHALTLLTDAPLPSAWEALIASRSDVRTVRLPGGPLWHWRAARLMLSGTIGDVYISPVSYIVPALLGRRAPHVPVVHDLIAFRNEPHERRATAIERLTFARAVRGAAAVCTVSDATRTDVLARVHDLSPATVLSVYAGGEDAPATDRHPDGVTVFCLGTLCPRKNQLRLIQAFNCLPAPLRSSCRLVLAGGRGWRDGDIVAAARATPGVTWIGHASEDALQSIWERATVFALPSLYEGFGLPVLEAMRRGVPVLTSSRGSLAEVTGGCAVTVDPLSLSAITHGLERLLTDAALRDACIRRGKEQALRYSWERTADLLLDACATVSRYAPAAS